VTNKDLARRLGISESMVSRLRKRGMPVDSPESAERWRRRHLAPARVKGARIDTAPRPAPVQPSAPPCSRIVAEFRRVARSAYATGETAIREILPPVAEYLRALLAALPIDAAVALYTGDDFVPREAIAHLCPPEFAAWDWAAPDELDIAVDAGEESLVIALALGRARLDWRPGKAWRPLREVVQQG